MGAHPGVLMLQPFWGIQEKGNERKDPGRTRVMSAVKSPGWILQGDIRLDTVWPLLGCHLPSCPHRTEPCLTHRGQTLLLSAMDCV